MAFSFMVCNSGPAVVTVLSYRKTAGSPGFELIDPRPELPSGKCIVVNEPTAVYLANYASQTIGAEGWYQAFPPDYFRLGEKPYRIIDAPQSPAPGPGPGSKVESRDVMCRRVAGVNPKTNVHSICAIDNLERRANYRLCFTKVYTTPQNDQNYPGTLLPMILDSSLRNRPSNNDEILWNPVAAESCRDIYDWRYGAMLVIPWRTDPKDRTWQPEKVDKISFTIERLP